MAAPKTETPKSVRFAQMVMIAAWFGIVTGLAEGILYLLLQKTGWVSRSMWLLPASIDIIWIACVFETLLYFSAGLALLLLSRFFPTLPILRWAVFLFSASTFVAFLQSPGKLHVAAVVCLALGFAASCARSYQKHEAAVLRFWRRTLPWAVGLALFAFGAIGGGNWFRERLAIRRLPPHAASAPNILVIVFDTLRADHLSLYGYPRATSPHIDRLAKESAWFENAVATSSWTLPSHASLLTGRYPFEHGADKLALDGRYPTLGEVLQRNGYRTGAFTANIYWFGRREGLARGFIRFEDYFQSLYAMCVRPFYGRMMDNLLRRMLGNKDLPARKSAPEVTSEALEWIDGDREKPFFAFLNYFDAHKPYLPPEPFLTKFAASKERFYGTPMFDGSDFTRMTPEQMQRDIDSYDGSIAFVDDSIGHLLAGLEARGILSNTLVVLTSDHGESFGEHGMFAHRNALYLEGIRVPLIFYWPEQLPAGLRVRQPISIAALPATLLEILGDAQQSEFPHPSLVHFWRTPSAQTDEQIPLAELAHMPDESFKPHPNVHGAMKSLLSSRWHYIVHDKFGPELYDWVQDPKELNNLVGTQEGKTVVGEFSALLHRMLAAPARTSSGSAPQLSNRVQRKAP